MFLSTSLFYPLSFTLKKALGVSSLVLSLGGGVTLPIVTRAALPFSTHKVQGISFGVVLHVLFFVH